MDSLAKKTIAILHLETVPDRKTSNNNNNIRQIHIEKLIEKFITKHNITR